MKISIEIPDDVAEQLRRSGKDLPRLGLEAFVEAACREKLISEPQAQSLLGLGTRFELDAFLKKRGIYLDYSEADFAADRLTLAKLLGDHLKTQLDRQGVSEEDIQADFEAYRSERRDRP